MPIVAPLPPIYRGEDRVIRFTVEGEGSIASWQFSFRLWGYRDQADAVAPALTLTSGSGIAIEDADARTVLVTLTDTQTEALVKLRYHGAFWRTNDGSEAPLWLGVCPVENR